MDNPKRYILSGKATFTLIDKSPDREGGGSSRYTYQVVRPRKGLPHFVRLLTGPDNTSNYTFIGTIFDGLTWRPKVAGAGSKLFGLMWRFASRGEWPEWLEIVGNGKCGKCGRMLTTPESVEMGIGPECLRKLSN